MVDRKGIIIYFQNKKVLKEIKKYKINIAYVNQGGKYLVGYCDAEEFAHIKKELKQHKLIRKIDESFVEMPTL
ncbi:MAG: DUF2129 domain-containing protein [Bacilli bacterium]|nr:DUF2129 domain-containing protein [Bacilli bacterium]MBN2877282.1 DUF2129 domain-containing protein [Bacilli bacterium]